MANGTCMIENWISVGRALPSDSRKVLITDGVNVSCAHYFARWYNRPEMPPDWVNQHERITGGYITQPTHWRDVHSLLLEVPNVARIARCPECGDVFSVGRRRRVYCRRGCQVRSAQRAYRLRRRAGR